MKNYFTPILNFSLLLTTFCFFSTPLQAQTRKIETYYPSVVGEYSKLQLLPQSPTAPAFPTPCTALIGTMYANNTGNLQFCYKDATGLGQWGVPYVWTRDNTELLYHLTNIAIYPQVRVGIGTITPEFKLTLYNDPGILATGTFNSGATLPNNLGAGSRMIWYPRKASLRAGDVGVTGTYPAATQWDDANIGNYSAAFGKNSVASGNYSIVGGGEENIASGLYTAVGGGNTNTVSGNNSAIAGGRNNSATGTHSAIWGGQSNSSTANYTGTGGGQNNRTTSNYTAIGGGVNNTIGTPYSIIHGGQNNTIDFAGVGAAIGYAVINGGNNNRARNNYTVVGGGDSNTASGSFSYVGGGQSNVASGQYATIAGGRSNTASGNYSTIGGGNSNTASGNFSTIGSGERNLASGDYALIMGGTDNTAAGDFSWAQGRNINITANADRTFAWGYSDDNSQRINVNVPDAFIIAPGRISSSNWNPRVGIRDQNPQTVLEINNDGAIVSGFRGERYLKIAKSTSSGTTENVLSIFLAGDSIFGVPYHTYIGVGRNADLGSVSRTMIFGNANNAYLTGDGKWISASSRKYKENIKPLNSEDAQQCLDQLQPVTFNYNGTPQQVNAGFIAEDVPTLVATNDRKTLVPMEFIATLTKTIQDQDKQIREQHLRLEKIKNKLRELKLRLNE